MFFIWSKFPVFFITFMRLPLPVFMDSSGDVAVSVSSLFFSFVSVQSHDRNRKEEPSAKKKSFSQSLNLAERGQSGKPSKMGTCCECN